MNYKIIRGDASLLNTAREERIADVPWGSTYTPDSRFCGVFVEGKGFLFRLRSFESNPRTEHKNHWEEVCEDSCLEIFLNFAPEKSRSYINFEMNAIGSYLFGIGPDRHDRVELRTPHMPEVKAEIGDGVWTVTLFIPIETIEAVYGKIDFKAGYTFTGNAFKCGDLTPSPHYLSWAPLQRDVVDFHRSDKFGSFTLL
ncbi:MAG: hypothetical protein IKC69_07725 [Clostridia bacterium]|nr:hypothetical protein [Clostridia bacterium]